MQTKSFKNFVRSRYAWPGGYPLFALCSDGGVLCHACSKTNAKQIIRSTRSNSLDGWAVAGVDINYEDASLYCDNCNSRIESAYVEE